MPQRWLFKTEPSSFSWEDLVRDGRAVWDGVSNALALKHLRSAAKGDSVIVYHTGEVKAAVGLARITSDPYPDPRSQDPKLTVVDLVPDRRLERPVTLAEMRKKPELDGFDLLRLSRLSIVPVSEAHWKTIVEMAR